MTDKGSQLFYHFLNLLKEKVQRLEKASYFIHYTPLIVGPVLGYLFKKNKKLSSQESVSQSNTIPPPPIPLPPNYPTTYTLKVFFRKPVEYPIEETNVEPHHLIYLLRNMQELSYPFKDRLESLEQSAQQECENFSKNYKKISSSHCKLLAKSYLLGNHGVQNISKAFEWFENAAFIGDSKALPYVLIYYLTFFKNCIKDNDVLAISSAVTKFMQLVAESDLQIPQSASDILKLCNRVKIHPSEEASKLWGHLQDIYGRKFLREAGLVLDNQIYFIGQAQYWSEQSVSSLPWS